MVMTCNDVKYTCYVIYLLSYVITDRHVRRGLLLQKMLLSWRLMHHHSILPGRLLLLPHRMRRLLLLHGVKLLVGNWLRRRKFAALQFPLWLRSLRPRWHPRHDMG